ncbi:MAG: DUF3488 domain-containing transglutaminase family protein [Burkholderiales bacterium]|nr:DUF3488 domain-containing transglutaminase family protein [Burkholderiales bacterium]
MLQTLLATLRTLPRDARDTLFLLGVIGWIIAPQFDHLPLWCSAMVALVLLWRARLALRGLLLPSRWWLLALLALATGATLYTHKTILGRDAGVTFLVVLLALKTLELRARRDAFVVFFLGFFILLSNFFFSQSLLIAFAMLLGLLGLLTALVNSHMPVGKPPLVEAAKTAGGMALLGAPIMVVLFVLFPRVAPLWGVPSDAMAGRSGLSDTMQVGTIAKLALDSSVAMRIRFDGPAPHPSALYFRGPVLGAFDGRAWRPAQPGLPPRLDSTPALQVSGPAVGYQVTLNSSNQAWLLALDATPEAPTVPGHNPRMTHDLQWVAERTLVDPVRYHARSYPQFRHGPLQAVPALNQYLELPRGLNPRTAQWAAELRRDVRYTTASTPALVDAVLERLRTGGYTYTLEPGVFGAHTADEFWFDRKEGFCEHIASSFVLLMRALGVPARIVTGYQGGEINGVDGYWTVRQSDAHAWTEVWVANQGWVRVDPTSAVAPGRTGANLRLEPPTGVIAQALGVVSPALHLNLRAWWEAANNRWNQWVLNYSQSKQLDLLRNIGFDAPDWADLGYVLIGVMVFVSLLGAAWTLWERQRQDPWLRLLQRATQRLQHAGLAVPAQAPPRQLARLLGAAPAGALSKMDDTAKAALCQWLLQLEAWRYAPHSPPGGNPVQRRRALATLQRQFRQLRWPPRAR